jgi:hypothetical protein
VDGAPYAQEYGCGQTGQGISGRNRRRLNDRRTKIMGKSARCAGLRPNSLVGLRGGLWIAHSRIPSGNPMYYKGFTSLSYPLPFSLIGAERIPSFALMDYKVHARAFIKKSIQKGCNPLLPTYAWGILEEHPCTRRTDPLSLWMISSCCTY